jgi:twitching motility protein PilI
MSKKPVASVGRCWLTPTAALSRANQTHRLGTDARAQVERQFLRYGFRVGPLRLMAGSDVLSELLREVQVYALPGAPQWVAGLLNLRGNLVPVFDLHRLFGFGHVKEKGRDLLALDRGPATVCVYVDDLPERVAMDHQVRNLPPLPARLKDHVTGAFSGNGTIWIEFAHAAFFRSLASA